VHRAEGCGGGACNTDTYAAQGVETLAEYSSSFYLPNDTTVLRSIQLRRAEQQGPTGTLTAAPKRLIKQLLGTHSITQVKYCRQTRKVEKSFFSFLFLKNYLKM